MPNLLTHLAGALVSRHMADFLAHFAKETEVILPEEVFMELKDDKTGTAGNRYGVYGSASGGTFNAAGYFDGDVWADSYNILSDRKFKTRITQLKLNFIGSLKKLKPSAYEFNTPAYPKMGLPKGKQLGLIPDEVKQVFPELVKEAVHPAEYSQDKKEVLRPEEKFEGVNYIGFIPVLIASLQEQQKTIATLRSYYETRSLSCRF